MAKKLYLTKALSTEIKPLEGPAFSATAIEVDTEQYDLIINFYRKITEFNYYLETVAQGNKQIPDYLKVLMYGERDSGKKVSKPARSSGSKKGAGKSDKV